MKITGLIDIHTHGIKRYDTRTDNPGNILKIAQFHALAGTAAILPTIYSGTIQQMRLNMEAVRKAIKAQSTEHPERRPKSYASGQVRKGTSRTQIKNSSFITTRLSPPKSHLPSLILGIYLEGPFLNPIKCGAQGKNTFINPAISSLKKLIGGYEDIIKIITIAPELPGALKVIERCVSLGIKINMGHSDATYTQALNGKKAGATGITHIFNAMRPFHHREPGLTGLGLLDEDLYIEVIADNVHLSHSSLNIIFKIKRRDRIILVSDSVKEGKDILRSKGHKDRKGRIYSKPGVIAGSSITLSDAVRNIIKIGIPETLAIEAAVDNPERYLTI